MVTMPPEEVLPAGALIGPDQAVRLMAIGILIRDGDLDIRGDNREDVATAREMLIDVSQEIALQVGAEGDRDHD